MKAVGPLCNLYVLLFHFWPQGPSPSLLKLQKSAAICGGKGQHLKEEKSEGRERSQSVLAERSEALLLMGGLAHLWWKKRKVAKRPGQAKRPRRAKRACRFSLHGVHFHLSGFSFLEVLWPRVIACIIYCYKLVLHSTWFLHYGQLRCISAIFSPLSLVFHEDSKYATLEIERYVLLAVPS